MGGTGGRGLNAEFLRGPVVPRTEIPMPPAPKRDTYYDGKEKPMVEELTRADTALALRRPGDSECITELIAVLADELASTDIAGSFDKDTYFKVRAARVELVLMKYKCLFAEVDRAAPVRKPMYKRDLERARYEIRLLGDLGVIGQEKVQQLQEQCATREREIRDAIDTEKRGRFWPWLKK